MSGKPEISQACKDIDILEVFHFLLHLVDETLTYYFDRTTTLRSTPTNTHTHTTLLLFFSHRILNTRSIYSPILWSSSADGAFPVQSCNNQLGNDRETWQLKKNRFADKVHKMWKISSQWMKQKYLKVTLCDYFALKYRLVIVKMVTVILTHLSSTMRKLKM